MKKTDIETIKLQEEEIRRLKNENKKLWRGYLGQVKIAERLIKENKALKNTENELEGYEVG